MGSGRSKSEAYETLTIELKVLRWSPSDPADQPTCPECRGTLDLNQPDEESPSELLGTCAGCRRWFLVGDADDEGGMLLIKLPRASAILRRVESKGGGSKGRGEKRAPDSAAD